ncbi:unnamed protein product [Arabidopsis thaliana]|uniref:Reverse transcriptase zinc-binding domain-containing protein n=1 Tax=Arabidopsis thaliana TaxID=3702 RepID=A0A654ER20_ARATH|nr:unnamed protein product [Arabidopsis thaliana]
MIYLTSIDLPTLSGELDVYDWVVEDKLCNGFSSAKTWAALRPRSDVVSWAKTVWFKGATPKHAFHMWVTNLDRLPTKTRLASWGMQLQTTCGLCSLDIEDRDHLFLTCEFACFLWHTVSVRLELPAFSFVVWNDLMDWTLQRNRRSPPTLRKLIVQSVLYAIWKQRNNFLHNHETILPSVVFKTIDREIKNSITARRLNKRFRRLMTLWLH